MKCTEKRTSPSACLSSSLDCPSSPSAPCRSRQQSKQSKQAAGAKQASSGSRASRGSKQRQPAAEQAEQASSGSRASSTYLAGDGQRRQRGSIPGGGQGCDCRGGNGDSTAASAGARTRAWTRRTWRGRERPRRWFVITGASAPASKRGGQSEQRRRRFRRFHRGWSVPAGGSRRGGAGEDGEGLYVRRSEHGDA